MLETAGASQQHTVMVPGKGGGTRLATGAIAGFCALSSQQRQNQKRAELSARLWSVRIVFQRLLFSCS